MTAVPDTSILIDGKISKLIEEEKLTGEIIIPELVVDELENQANKGKETGFNGINEINKIRKLSEQKKGITLSFVGRKPTEEEINLASNGRIDALIRDIAEDSKGTLYTGDKVQAEIAKAKGIQVELIKQETVNKFSLEKYFDEKTMSVHLKQDAIPKVKRGLTVQFELEEIRKEKINKKNRKTNIRDHRKSKNIR